MTTIALIITRLSFFNRKHGCTADLTSLSDNSLQDIGFKLARRDLNAIKPFWAA
jgi:uncharacterized protein YjiS (DUF1127 family)